MRRSKLPRCAEACRAFARQPGMQAHDGRGSRAAIHSCGAAKAQLPHVRAHAGSADEGGGLLTPLRRAPGMPGCLLAQPALPAGTESNEAASPAAPAGRHMSCARSAWRWGWALRNAVSNKAAHHPGQTSTHAPCAQLVAGMASQRAARAGSGRGQPDAHTGSLRLRGLERGAEARAGPAAGLSLGTGGCHRAALGARAVHKRRKPQRKAPCLASRGRRRPAPPGALGLPGRRPLAVRTWAVRAAALHVWAVQPQPPHGAAARQTEHGGPDM